MTNKMILIDVKSTYYNVLNNEEEPKRYLHKEEAIVESNAGEKGVVKVTKRILETIEFEKVQ